MNKLVLITALIAFALQFQATPAKAATSEQIQRKTISFFKEISTLRSSGYFVTNPGGFSAKNAKAYDWDTRMMAFNNAIMNAGKAGDSIINIPGGGSVWISDLIDLKFAIVGKELKDTERLLAKFWLATICLENKEVCDKYMQRHSVDDGGDREYLKNLDWND